MGQAGGRAGRLGPKPGFRSVPCRGGDALGVGARVAAAPRTAERHLHACIAAAGMLLRVPTQHGMESRAQVLELGLAKGWEGYMGTPSTHMGCSECSMNSSEQC